VQEPSSLERNDDEWGRGTNEHALVTCPSSSRLWGIKCLLMGRAQDFRTVSQSAFGWSSRFTRHSGVIPSARSGQHIGRDPGPSASNRTDRSSRAEMLVAGEAKASACGTTYGPRVGCRELCTPTLTIWRVRTRIALSITEISVSRNGPESLACLPGPTIFASFVEIALRCVSRLTPRIATVKALSMSSATALGTSWVSMTLNIRVVTGYDRSDRTRQDDLLEAMTVNNAERPQSAEYLEWNLDSGIICLSSRHRLSPTPRCWEEAEEDWERRLCK
jgi:hypothetical protein